MSPNSPCAVVSLDAGTTISALAPEKSKSCAGTTLFFSLSQDCNVMAAPIDRKAVIVSNTFFIEYFFVTANVTTKYAMSGSNVLNERDNVLSEQPYYQQVIITGYLASRPCIFLR